MIEVHVGTWIHAVLCCAAMLQPPSRIEMGMRLGILHGCSFNVGELASRFRRRRRGGGGDAKVLGSERMPSITSHDGCISGSAHPWSWRVGGSTASLISWLWFAKLSNCHAHLSLVERSDPGDQVEA